MDQNNIRSFFLHVYSNMAKASYTALCQLGEERQVLLQDSSQVPRVWSGGDNFLWVWEGVAISAAVCVQQRCLFLQGLIASAPLLSHS